MPNIKTRLEKLRETINHHRYLYHVLDRQAEPPPTSDVEGEKYDHKYRLI